MVCVSLQISFALGITFSSYPVQQTPKNNKNHISNQFMDLFFVAYNHLKWWLYLATDCEQRKCSFSKSSLMWKHALTHYHKL